MTLIKSIIKSVMATLILKSLATAYVIVGIFILVASGGSENAAMAFFLGPIAFWPATLVVSGLALLVYLAIAEHRT